MGDELADDLRACSFDAWYPRLRCVSIRSAIVPLPVGFISYLLDDADGLFLPPPPAGAAGGASGGSDASGSPGWTDDEEGDGGGDGARAPAQHGPAAFGFDVQALFAQIDAAIARLGGAAFPKLNWSAPRDAAWLLGGTMRCACARDVVSLLKCSQHVAHDLREHAPHLGPPGATEPARASRSVLALRRWCELNPARELRCFAHSGALLALCQRDRHTHYAHLADERDELVRHVRAFWDASLAADAEFGVPRGRPCAVDVYVDGASAVHVVDVAPFADATTDALLFAWEELAALAARAAVGSPPDPPELRLVGAEGARVRPSAALYAGIPLELHPGRIGGEEGRDEGEGQAADAAAAIALVRAELQPAGASSARAHGCAARC
ncbi:hypothetical protein KFE25_006922 [Diacronema lutheri]|uniref:Cell division cycle protein 123 homolog n=3 Tax=Diacronema lutheri TaxID=2081491 RepID=A0A8J6CFC5_DIALT|nr:hypothetical protein KFE25_006922 [Diacronema lutheri]